MGSLFLEEVMNEATINSFNARADAIFRLRKKTDEWKIPWAFARFSTTEKIEGVPETEEKNGSSGRTRTYNPPVNSRMLCH